MLRNPARKRLSVLLAMLPGGACLVAVVAICSILALGAAAVHLSPEASSTQLRQARVRSGFEHIAGAFSRLSLASSPSDISEIGNEIQQDTGEIRSLSADFPSLAGNISALERTGSDLCRIVRERIDARTRASSAVKDALHEAEAVLAVTHRLANDMERLERSNQTGLVASKKIGRDASSAVEALLSERMQAEQLRSSVQQIRVIDRKLLNTERDNAAAILAAMASHETSDPGLNAQLHSFASRFAALFDGDRGLLAARAAAIAAPPDKAQSVFEEREKAALAVIDELSARITEQIDTLELTARKAGDSIDGETELSARIAAVSRLAGEIDGSARTMEILAWQLDSATDQRALARFSSEASSRSERADAKLVALRESLVAMKNQNRLADVDAARAAFSHARDLLTGDAGLAVAVRQTIEAQSAADRLLASARESIGNPGAGTNAAESAGNNAALIRHRSAWAIAVVGIAAFCAVSLGIFAAGRIRAGVFESEARHNRATAEMRSTLAKIAECAQALHLMARRLSETRQAVSGNVEQIASGAGGVHSGIAEIVKNASEAVAVGASATELAGAASSAVSALETASSDIGNVTGMIREIAFKTTLLSLNAAVEAAHAGAAGAGFAVVADEVKNLAAIATDSTEQIDARVAAMAAQVGKVTGAISEIACIVARMRTLQESIAVTARRQTSATALISAGIEQTVRQCNGTSSRDGIEAIAAELSTLAASLEAVGPPGEIAKSSRSAAPAA